MDSFIQQKSRSSSVVDIRVILEVQGHPQVTVRLGIVIIPDHIMRIGRNINTNTVGGTRKPRSGNRGNGKVRSLSMENGPTMEGTKSLPQIFLRTEQNS